MFLILHSLCSDLNLWVKLRVCNYKRNVAETKGIVGICPPLLQVVDYEKPQRKIPLHSTLLCTDTRAISNQPSSSTEAVWMYLLGKA